MKKKIEFLISLPKSIYINFRVLNLKQAIKLPILVHYRTKLKIFKECIAIKERRVKFGMIRLGFGGSEGITSNGKNYLLIEKNGKMIISKKFTMGKGFSIRIDNGILKIGNNVGLNKNCFIAVNQEIVIGENSIFGWNVQLRDSDGHIIEGSKKDGKINIGASNWIGANVIVLKNVQIENNNVIALGSIVTSSLAKEKNKINSVLIGGYPAKILKKNIKWEK